MTSKIKLLVTLFLAGFTVSTFADYPVVSYRYLADPASLVCNGRVYLYCSNDDDNPAGADSRYQMKSIVCVSSSDLKNWTDHGIVFQVPRDAAWAGYSWAPSAVERNGKFYLYFGNSGNGIGVATADSPTGPFTDPIGQALVTINTPGVLPAEHIWVFDPMTFVNDDGQTYMYFGGNGDWIKVRGVDFGSAGPASFVGRIACVEKNGASKESSIEIRIDDATGTLIGTVPVSFTGGADRWESETVATEKVTGVHDLYFVFSGGDEKNLFNFDYWYFLPGN